MVITAPISNACFNQVTVSYDPAINGVLVQWWLRVNPGAGSKYTLQFSYSPDPDPALWENVASDFDVCYLRDTAKRLYGGLDQLAYYRVVIDTVDARQLVSFPVQLAGGGNRHNFLLAREIIRKELLRLKKSTGGTKGWLLKAKKFGEECTRCLDQDTKESTDSDCPLCFGTGITGGYHRPIEFWFEMGLKSHALENDPNYGTLGFIMQQCRAIGVPGLDDADLWVNAETNERFFIFGIQNQAQINGPIIVTANLHQATYDDPVYKVAVTV